MTAGTEPAWLPAPDDRTVSTTLTTAFTERYGQAPLGVWSAPGRVNLVGEHTDYNEGLCLPLALPHRTYAAVRLRRDGTVRLASLQQQHGWQGSLQDVGPGRPAGWAAYALGVLWALREGGIAVPGMDVLVDGRVPVGSGLSSSAALECAVAAACADLVPGVGALSAGELAALCVTAENTVAGASTGGLDQTTALRAVEGHAMLLDCRGFTVQHVPWRLGDHGWQLLVIDTRAPHALVGGPYAERRRSCEKAAAALGVASLREVDPARLPSALDVLSFDGVLARRTRHVVTEIDRVRRAAGALAGDDVTALGELMVASHVSLRDDYEVSCPELDLTAETALTAGAVGARMTGGGFGGSAIALVRREQASRVAEAVTRAFVEQGWRRPQFLDAVPAAAAGRVASPTAAGQPTGGWTIHDRV